MNFNHQDGIQWPAPPGFMFNSATAGPDAYHAPNAFSALPSDHYHYNLAYTAPYPTSNCPRSYNALDLTGLPNDLAMADSFPPNAYHIEPPKHHDAMDLSDHETKTQLMQLSNDYEHTPYGCSLKIEDHNGYHSPYSDPTHVSTPHDDASRSTLDLDTGEGGMFDKEQPYAQLIYQALLNAPGHTMILRDIYDWFKNNTDKASASETKGWQNSIRHNLSMNGAFEKVDQPGDEARKGFMWRLTEQAIREGVKSTTRYRSKQPNKRGHRSQQPQPQRQASGAKGGQAARRAARLKRSARLHEAYRSAQHMSRSVPASFDPSYYRSGFSSSHPSSPFHGSDADFGYGSQHGDYPASPLPDSCPVDFLSSAASYVGSPMSQGMPITDTACLLDQSPSDSLFTNSPSPSADEPRTPMDQDLWHDDVAMGPSCMFEDQLVYRENAS
ncbi:uncharacterized protein SETTUDRAFT_88512 [Exserohilum turcica Et28A]|uniref:Fork-head domain-containing protein n=1 Tax=Exserohilum turcicum (strain 28A) TaxID=671987 RepID=R0KBA8_EXST2|nr:uncharacterized protein SETTUDRAFT_88512 [Exserohilum turcica Et28A]EOA86644.1 hypothetical protein SETTUDRAFT_88512 [Exserohilum turcica Et28A]